MKLISALLTFIVVTLVALTLAVPVFACGGGGGGGGGPDGKCNSGRGNGSETSSPNLIVPGEGTGPGVHPTAPTDCDPGQSGAVNRGGD